MRKKRASTGKTDLSRTFLKADRWDSNSFELSDQQKGMPCPPVQKPVPSDAVVVDLPDPMSVELSADSLKELIENRRSRRTFSDAVMTLNQLSYLCRAAQGIQKVFGDGQASFRTVPSAGARHGLELYLTIHNVETLQAGLYRYLGVEHQLLQIDIDIEIAQKCADACCDQQWMAQADAVFALAAMPYRMEWRYGSAAGKLIALDAGHACQNIYLACESINLGCCAVAAYHQSKVDALLRLDGNDEFCVYLAAVGTL